MSRFILSLVFPLVLVAASHSASADALSERKANFRANLAAMKAIAAAAQSDEFAEIAKGAQTIADWAGIMADYFPAGSDTGDTKAKPEIWANWDDFLARASLNREAALRLAALAQERDSAAIPDAIKALSASCSGCHKPYKY